MMKTKQKVTENVENKLIFFSKYWAEKIRINY